MSLGHAGGVVVAGALKTAVLLSFDQAELDSFSVALQASTLGNWFTGLLQRHDQLGKWLTLGRPRAYWLTGFFNPQVGDIRLCVLPPAHTAAGVEDCAHASVTRWCLH